MFERLDMDYVLDWIQDKYSELVPTVTHMDYDTVVIYLHNPRHNWLSGCKIVYYNANYDEFSVYDLKPID